MDPKQPPAQSPPPPPPPTTTKTDRDFLTHLELYLAKRDGVDKLLKISRYAAKLIISTSPTTTHPLTTRLSAFESSVGLSRKAFRLGKFIQDINALRASDNDGALFLTTLAYAGEGLYYFVEQFVWLCKSGLIDKRQLKVLQKVSAWAEFVGYIGSVSLKVRDFRRIVEDEKCLVSSVEVASLRGDGKCCEEIERLRKLREKKFLKRLSIVQDFADGLMALSDIRDGQGRLLSSPVVLSSAGLLSAVISTHKNWLSC